MSTFQERLNGDKAGVPAQLLAYEDSYDSWKRIATRSSEAGSYPSPTKVESKGDEKEVFIFWSLAKKTEIRLALAVNLSVDAVDDIDPNFTTGNSSMPSYSNINNDEMIKIQQLNQWIGFGISDMGGMIGSDMFLYAATGESTSTVLDCHGVEYGKPHLDQCGQDWIYVNSKFAPVQDGNQDEDCGGEVGSNRDNFGWLVVEVKRSLLSSDVNEDRPFIDDSSPLVPPTKIIVAWGRINDRKDDISVQGDPLQVTLLSRMQPHGASNKVKGGIRFFGGGDNRNENTMKRAKKMEQSPDEDEKINRDGRENETDELFYIDLIPDEPFQIPSAVTTYKNFCFSLSDFPEFANNNDFYIIKFEDLLSENESKSLVHHMDLHGTNDQTLGSDARLCRAYMDMIHPWEAGSSRVFSMPKETGIPIGLGTKDAYKAFRVEVHYHNPALYIGREDQSGLRIHYSRRKPKYEAALMLVGDPNLSLIGQPTVEIQNDHLKTGGTKHSFYCPSSCFTNDTMNGEAKSGEEAFGVTVFKEVFHMHRTGARMTSIQFNRSGDTIRAAEINRFDFSQGAGFSSRAQIPFQISPGDSFATSCYFEERGVYFGSGSDQEMCQIFLWYYPKSDKLSCGYFDADAREKEQKLNADLKIDHSTYGCEVTYDSKMVVSESDLDRMNGVDEMDLHQEDKQCQRPSLLGSRPISGYPLFNVSATSDWTPLFAFMLDDNTNTTSVGNGTTAMNSSSSAAARSCTLCRGGRKPKLPEKKIMDTEGLETGWSCDEMDAWIPIMFSDPDLVNVDRTKIHSCKSYRKYFGRICGCPSRHKKHKKHAKKLPENTVKAITRDSSSSWMKVVIPLVAACCICFAFSFFWYRKKSSTRKEDSEKSIEITPILSTYDDSIETIPDHNT